MPAQSTSKSLPFLIDAATCLLLMLSLTAVWVWEARQRPTRVTGESLQNPTLFSPTLPIPTASSEPVFPPSEPFVISDPPPVTSEAKAPTAPGSASASAPSAEVSTPTKQSDLLALSFLRTKESSTGIARTPPPPEQVVDRLLTTSEKLDKFGNPEGENLGLVGKKEFEGATLLAWSVGPEVNENIFTADNPLWAALREKGFKVRLESGPFRTAWLTETDQFWLFSTQVSGMNDIAEEAVVGFVQSGKGLYLIADNEPYLVDADRLARRLYQTRVSGNFVGRNLIAVRGRGVTGSDFRASQRQKNNSQSSMTDRLGVIERATHYAEEHPLLTDVNFIFEGSTISHLDPCLGLQTVLKASDGQILAAVATDPMQRVVVDCGFTRYMYSSQYKFVVETAGTIRYAENIAAYLMGKDGKDGGGNWMKLREQRALLAEFAKAPSEKVLAAFADADLDQRFAAVVTAHRRQLNVPDKYIEMLRDANDDVRQQARAALRSLAEGADCGPPRKATPDVIDEAIAAWVHWFEKYKLIANFCEKRAEELEQLLTDSNLQNRWAAVTAIGRLKLKLPDALIAKLADEAADVREQAHRALVMLTGVDHGPQADDEATRAAAIIAWRRWRLPQKYAALYHAETPALVAALKSENVEMRWAAANAILTRRLRLGHELIALVDHPDAQLRQEAVQALVNSFQVNIGPTPNANPAEIAAAKREWESWWRRETAMRADQALKLAKTFLENRPEVAKRRLQEVIQQYPNSDAAVEASELLKDL